MNNTAPPLDFLARVALPTLGSVPVVRPRLPSMFESRRVDLEEEVLEQPAEAMLERPSLLRELMPPSRSVSQPVSLPTPVGQAAPRSIAPTAELSPAEKPPTDPVKPTQAANGPALRVPVAATPTVATKRNSTIDDRNPSVARRQPLQPLETRAPTVPERRQRHAERQDKPAPSAPKSRQSAAGVRRDEVRRITVASEPTSRQARPAARPIIMPAAPPVPNRREGLTAQLPAAPPAINITIGRIDIRAATPAPVAPPPAPRAVQKEPQSLDDYLKSRAGRT